MALYDVVDELPAALAAAAGPERFGSINAAFERLKPGFDGEDWMSDNRGWLARGMVNGEIDAVRLWLAWPPRSPSSSPGCRRSRGRPPARAAPATSTT